MRSNASFGVPSRLAECHENSGILEMSSVRVSVETQRLILEEKVNMRKLVPTIMA